MLFDFESQSEWEIEIYGANVKWESVTDCTANEGEGPLSISLSVCRWHAERENKIPINNKIQIKSR